MFQSSESQHVRKLYLECLNSLVAANLQRAESEEDLLVVAHSFGDIMQPIWQARPKPQDKEILQLWLSVVAQSASFLGSQLKSMQLVESLACQQQLSALFKLVL